MSLADTAYGGFIEKKGRGWMPIRTAPQDGAVIDVWLTIHASPLSMGMADTFGVQDVWYENGKWVHLYQGKTTALDHNYITHWREKKQKSKSK